MIELGGHWIDYEWGVQYEMNADPDMSGGPTEVTNTNICSKKIAEKAAMYGIPKSGRNHRVVRRMVSEWREEE